MSAPIASRSDPRLNTILERMRNASVTRGARVIAFTAPHPDAGTTLIAGIFARRLHEAGLKVLLIDASLPMEPLALAAGWEPGDGQAASMIASRPNGPDQLWIMVNPDDAGRFNDPQRIRAMMEVDLAHYDAILVDCAPVEIGSGAAIEAMTIAAIAGATMLVVKANRTTGAERDGARMLLAECKADISGLLVNDVVAPRFGAELAREALRAEQLFPRLTRRIARWAQNVTLFDVPA